MSDKMIEKVLRWVLFTVVVSCLPLIFAYLDAFIHSADTPGVGIVTDHGELYLVASALCATGVGELFGAKGGADKTKILAGGIAMIVVILCSYAYVTGSKNIPAAKAGIVVVAQFLALLVSIVISTVCVAASEVP